MKKLIYLISITFLVLQSCSSEDDSLPNLTIGQSYEGGIIFYIDATRQHGLIASNVRLMGEWGCERVLISGADGFNVGWGNQNTIDIISGCSEEGTAAKKCMDFSGGGYTDWYLPSLNELRQLNIQKYTLKSKLNLPEENFWSSTQSSASTAYYLNFRGNSGEGSSGVTSKDSDYIVIPIRSF